MIVQGRYHRIGNQWVAEIPLLSILISSPPGKEKESLIGSIEKLAHDARMDIDLIKNAEENKFFFKVKNTDQFLPIILKRTRLAKKLSIAEVAKKLGHSSRNSYAQYEYGKTKLTFTKYLQIMEAMDPQMKIVLSTLQ
ncbi:MAG: helix-turn-helix transcriptional regulator [Bacteriovoracales bacterium]|nr:helix-turn-helix transcriptional regulator [Bacteriovoracales bacterium]